MLKLKFKVDNSTKRQFVRDYKLPIQIVDEEYFQYYIDLYQNQYQSRDKYNLFLQTLSQFETLEDFKNESRRIRQDAIDFISSKESYKSFSKDPLDDYFLNIGYKENLYKENNIGKSFLSIDLVQANIQAINYYDESILDGSKTYQEYISKFTDLEYFKNSKQIRQVIFGSLSPKKQQKIQKWIMGSIKKEIILLGVSEEIIAATSPDEIVLKLDHVSKDKKDSILEILKVKFNQFNFHIEEFKLDNVKEGVECYLKRSLINDKIDIKKCNSKLMPEIIKFIEGKDINEKDLAFLDEGRIAFYKKSIIFD